MVGRVFCVLLVAMVISFVKVNGQDISENSEVIDLLSLKEKAYYHIDEKALSKIESELLDIDFFGVVISAPNKINTNQMDILPLLVGIRYSGDRAWDFPVEENCIIVATNLIDGSKYEENLFYDESGKIVFEEEEQGDKPPGLAIASALVFKVDVRDIFELPWSTGQWGFSVLYNDWESNRVDIFLVGKDIDATKTSR